MRQGVYRLIRVIRKHRLSETRISYSTHLKTIVLPLRHAFSETRALIESIH